MTRTGPASTAYGATTAEEVGAWKVVAATVTGRGHLLRDAGNEDALHCTSLEDGTWLLALADGAGSASRAAEGARLVVDAAVMSLTARLSQESGAEPTELLAATLLDVRRAVATRLRESRASERLRARDLAATLLLALLRGDVLAVLQVGDGAVVRGSAGDWRRVTEPVRGRHAGETVFVTSRRAPLAAEVAVVELGADETLALLSDGLEPVATDLGSGEPHPPFFEPLATFARRDAPSELLAAELADFLASDRVQQRSPDDLSLVLAARGRG